METQFSNRLDNFSTICIFTDKDTFSTLESVDVSFPIPEFKDSLLYHYEGQAYLLLKAKDSAFEKGGKVISQIATMELSNPLVIPPKTDDISDFLLGLELGAYRFNHYFSNPKNKAPKGITVYGDDALEKEHENALHIAKGVYFTRDLISEPSNKLTPESFKDRLVETLEPLGVEVTVLDENDILDRKMMALHGVARGSRKKPFVVAMHWKGSDDEPVAFVGKGVCFDTGGISLKPSRNMHDMKYDMGGAGVVSGLMYALANRKAKANIVGVVGLVENMPDGNAQNPGDVVTSMSGQTIEVLNTDAEGRLVLADALTYVQKEFKPKAIVDLATLTGAIGVALGEHHAGLFSNNDKLSDELIASGKSTSEKIWRLPLGPEYDKDIDSDIADMQNIGKGGAGSITAAQFLGRFIENDTPWAHLDIASVTWSNKAKPGIPKGATGFGVRLLNHLVASHYETA